MNLKDKLVSFKWLKKYASKFSDIEHTHTHEDFPIGKSIGPVPVSVEKERIIEKHRPSVSDGANMRVFTDQCDDNDDRIVASYKKDGLKRIINISLTHENELYHGEFEGEFEYCKAMGGLNRLRMLGFWNDLDGRMLSVNFWEVAYEGGQPYIGRIYYRLRLEVDKSLTIVDRSIHSYDYTDSDFVKALGDNSTDNVPAIIHDHGGLRGRPFLTFTKGKDSKLYSWTVNKDGLLQVRQVKDGNGNYKVVSTTEWAVLKSLLKHTIISMEGGEVFRIGFTSDGKVMRLGLGYFDYSMEYDYSVGSTVYGYMCVSLGEGLGLTIYKYGGSTDQIINFRKRERTRFYRKPQYVSKADKTMLSIGIGFVTLGLCSDDNSWSIIKNTYDRFGIYRISSNRFQIGYISQIKKVNGGINTINAISTSEGYSSEEINDFILSEVNRIEVDDE